MGDPGTSATKSAASPSVSWPRGWPWRVGGALVGGLILRLSLWRAFPQNSGDALVYGGLAKNLILHGRFAITDGSGVLHATLIRLPGYPLFLAAIFRIFGVENYTAVAYLQIFLELIACLLLADFVRRISTPRAGLNTLWLIAMCPFTAVYASTAYTESLTLDCIILALWSLERYLSAIRTKSGCDESGLDESGLDESGCPTLDGSLASGDPDDRSSSWGWLRLGWDRRTWLPLVLFTVALSAAAMLRPDGALLAFALWPALLFGRGRATPFPAALRTALLCGVFAVLPFAPWAVRNWSVFHVFQPLAPRYATDPGEPTNPGWQHWVKTWCLDFTCTSEFYWNAPDGPLAMDDLPARAFDSPEQQEQTFQLLADYNTDQTITPEIDARFEKLAEDRTRAHPLRTWVELPLGRLADMTLRPRVENLPIDLRWWQYNQHWQETIFSQVYGLVNLFYLWLGLAGLARRPRFWPYMLAYLVLRSLLLMMIEAPETRYTLEFFPILCATAGIELQQAWQRTFRRNVPETG
jgi:hypothetical protein